MKRRVVLTCGHEFVESGPDGMSWDVELPRVCSDFNHTIDDPGVLWMTDQLLAMSEVVEYVPESSLCARCGHRVRPFTMRCGYGADAEGRPLCHPNEPGHPDCYTLATRTFGREVAK